MDGFSGFCVLAGGHGFVVEILFSRSDGVSVFVSAEVGSGHLVGRGVCFPGGYCVVSLVPGCFFKVALAKVG